MPRDRDTAETDDPDTMTDHDNPDNTLDPADPTTHTETVEKRFGQRGDETWNKEDTATDTARGVTKEVETLFPYCDCGEDLADATKSYRCCICDGFACNDCRIIVRSKKYCPDCIEDVKDLSRELYYALYLVKIGLKTPEDLVDARTADTPLGEVHIDATANELLERGLVRTEHTPTSAAALSDEDRLTADGRELFHIAEDLYGDDSSAEAFKQEAQKQLAVQRGR